MPGEAAAKQAEGVEKQLEDLADHEKPHFSLDEITNGAMKKLYEHHEVPTLALRLLRGHTVFSQDWKSDLWLHMKNKQPFVSILLAHPKHPFRRRERIMALSVSCLLAWGMEAWFCRFWTSCQDHPEKDFITLFIQVLLFKIIVSAVINGVYDAVMELAFTCACVQTHHTDFVKNLAEKLSYVQFVLQLAIALAGLVAGFALIILRGSFVARDLITATREMVVGKIVGLLVVTMLLEFVGFFAGRRAQMKPSGEEALRKWDAPTRGCCGTDAPPPNQLWNKFIGPKNTFDDLPALAPTYDVNIWICGKAVYSERADNRAGIPRCCKRRNVNNAILPGPGRTESPTPEQPGKSAAEA